MSEYISKEDISRVLLERIGANESCSIRAKEHRLFESKYYFDTLVFEDAQITSLIEELPSADVRPNIHARWESDGHGHIICIACKGVKLNTHMSKFCDSCGAIMDGERQCERCIYHKENGCTRWVCIDAEVEPKVEKGREE